MSTSAKQFLASERVVHGVLEKAARRARRAGMGTTMPPTPDVAAMAQDSAEGLRADGFFDAPREDSLEADQVTYFSASEGALGLARFVCADGPHPKAMLTRFVWIVEKIAPELLLNMSGRDWAKIVGESPWAWHARSKVIRQQVKRAVGLRSLVFPTEKSATSKQRMARAAKGNKHRANSVAA